MKETKFDVVIIGAGSGGYSAAIKLAKLGYKVALVEKDKIGGVCLNYGCIPTKTYLSALSINLKKKTLNRMGINLDIKLDFKKLFKYKEFVVSTLVKGIVNSLKKHGVFLFKDEAYIEDEGYILLKELNEKLIYKILILDLGSKPKILNNLDFNFVKTSKDLLTNLDIVKDSLIIGGGIIGLEFANILNLLNKKVYIIEFLPKILPNLDEDIVKVLVNNYKKRKIDILTNFEVSKIENIDNSLYKVFVKEREKMEIKELESLQILLSIGRQPNTKVNGFDKIFPLDKDNTFKVNEYLNIDGFLNVFAIGDCASQPFLAHKAYYDADIVVNNLSNKEKLKVNYFKIPSVIYTNPSIAYIGFTYKQAKDKFKNIDIIDYPVSALSKALVENLREGFVRLVLQAGKIIGIEIVSEYADLLLAGFLPYLGEYIKDVDIVLPHPSFVEIYKEIIDIYKGLSLVV